MQEGSVGLSMSRQQIRLCGTYPSSFSAHSYGYDPSNSDKLPVVAMITTSGPPFEAYTL
jgi:hypothetical protein